MTICEAGEYNYAVTGVHALGIRVIGNRSGSRANLTVHA